MRLTVLSVAYPLAPVGPDAVGGAEQILAAIDAALVRDGHRSLVIACEGSSVAGELFELPLPRGLLSTGAKSSAQTACRLRIREVLGREQVDVVHFHGLDFHAYLPERGPPGLATLHLPPELYPPEIFERLDGVFLHCVSSAQRRRCPRAELLLEDIPNGVDLARFRPGERKEDFALVLGRICPEKGIHLALDAARAAGLPLLLGGRVFPYPEHVRYFEEEILPRLDDERRFLGPVEMPRKAELLARARCLVVPSLIAETSSLVAMEALASGTPVVALRSGALPDLVDHGRTGFVADGMDGLVEGLRRSDTLSSAACRSEAEARFSAERMCRRYLELYARLSPCLESSELPERATLQPQASLAAS